MKANIVIVISPQILYLAEFWFLSYWPKCCQPIKLQDSLKCNISRKKWMMNVVFGMQINIEVFCKLSVCNQACPKVSKIRRFAYICNISRKAWGMKFIVCLQTNTKVFYKHDFGCDWSGMSKVLKTTNLQYLCNISRKTWRMKLIFCLQINVKGIFKIIFILGVRDQACPN